MAEVTTEIAEEIFSFDWDTFDFQIFRQNKAFPIKVNILLSAHAPSYVFLSAIDLLQNYLPSLVEHTELDLQYTTHYETEKGERNNISPELIVFQAYYTDIGLLTYLFRFGSDMYIPNITH